MFLWRWLSLLSFGHHQFGFCDLNDILDPRLFMSNFRFLCEWKMTLNGSIYEFRSECENVSIHSSLKPSQSSVIGRMEQKCKRHNSLRVQNRAQVRFPNLGNSFVFILRPWPYIFPPKKTAFFPHLSHKLDLKNRGRNRRTSSFKCKNCFDFLGLVWAIRLMPLFFSKTRRKFSCLARNTKMFNENASITDEREHVMHYCP